MAQNLLPLSPSVGSGKAILYCHTYSFYVWNIFPNSINQVVDRKLWTPFSLRNSNIKILNLFFFADNIIIFAKAAKKNAEMISNILQAFSSIAGLEINCDKSKPWFSLTTSKSFN